MASDHSAGVVVGLMAEARIARRLGWPVAIGGGTAAGAESAARRLIAAGAKGLVSLGLAGGLDPALRPGTLIVPSAVIRGDLRYPTDLDLSQTLGGTNTGAILGADAIAVDVAEKRCLYARSAAVAVDTESGAIASVAAESGVPFAVLRAICDPAQRGLPPAALAALGENGRIDAWQLILALVSRPSQLSELLGLAKDAAVARNALAARVRQIVQPAQT